MGAVDVMPGGVTGSGLIAFAKASSSGTGGPFLEFWRLCGVDSGWLTGILSFGTVPTARASWSMLAVTTQDRVSEDDRCCATMHEW